MSEHGTTQRLGRDFIFMEDGSLEPLRMSHLMHFLAKSGRNAKCPHCDWVGAWEIALNEENPSDEDPKLEILTLPSFAGTGLSTAALTCPRCGHFSQVSTYKIRQFLSAQGKSDE